MVETTETRAAARMGSSDAAVIAIGKLSATPSPHSASAAIATCNEGPKTKSSSPASALAAETRMTSTRPKRSRMRPPSIRATVIAVTNTP